MGSLRASWWLARRAFKGRCYRNLLFVCRVQYGPSVGLTREERWKRASAMGLSPPSEVMSALQRNPKTSLSVFDQRLNPDECSSFLAQKS